MITSSFGPVDPVAVIRAFVSFDLDVSFDRRVVVTIKGGVMGWGKVPVTSFWMPVFASNPFPGFVGVTPASPTDQFFEGKLSHFGKVIL